MAMRRDILKNLHRALRQLGQGMTEFILILAAVGIGGVFTYTQFGDVLRHQTAAGAKALAGLDGKGLTDAAREIAVTASAGASRGLGNFANPGSYDGGGLSEGGAGDGTNDGGSVGGAPGSDGGMPEGNGGTPGGEGADTGAGELPAPGDGGAMGGGTESLIAGNQEKYKVDSDPLTYKEVQNLVKLSPTLTADIAKLKAKGLGFRFTNGTSRVEFGENTIYISNKGNEYGVVQRLSHEVGHALLTVPKNRTSKEAYVQSRLEDEGAAVMKNIQVQREILLKNSGEDIGVNCGVSPCDGPNGRYTAIYEQYLIDGDAAAARRAIAEKRAEEPSGMQREQIRKILLSQNRDIYPNKVDNREIPYREYYEIDWEWSRLSRQQQAAILGTP